MLLPTVFESTILYFHGIRMQKYPDLGVNLTQWIKCKIIIFAKSYSNPIQICQQRNLIGLIDGYNISIIISMDLF